MGLSIWTQYVLDNFATVDEAVAAMSEDKFRIDSPDLPNGVQSRLHLAVTDASGDSAIFEYIDGRLSIHHGREYQVLTNSPTYDRQLAVNDYWRQIGGLVMLPGHEPFVRPFRARVILHQCGRAECRPENRRSDSHVSHAQRIRPIRNIHSRRTAYRIDALAGRRRPEKQGLFLRADTLDGDFPRESGGRGLFERLARARTHTQRRNDLYGDATSAFRPVSHPFDFLFGE